MLRIDCRTLLYCPYTGTVTDVPLNECAHGVHVRVREKRNDDEALQQESKPLVDSRTSRAVLPAVARRQ